MGEVENPKITKYFQALASFSTSDPTIQVVDTATFAGRYPYVGFPDTGTTRVVAGECEGSVTYETTTSTQSGDTVKVVSNQNGIVAVPIDATGVSNGYVVNPIVFEHNGNAYYYSPISITSTALPTAEVARISGGTEFIIYGTYTVTGGSITFNQTDNQVSGVTSGNGTAIYISCYDSSVKNYKNLIITTRAGTISNPRIYNDTGSPVITFLMSEPSTIDVNEIIRTSSTPDGNGVYPATTSSAFGFTPTSASGSNTAVVTFDLATLSGLKVADASPVSIIPRGICRYGGYVYVVGDWEGGTRAGLMTYDYDTRLNTFGNTISCDDVIRGMAVNIYGGMDNSGIYTGYTFRGTVTIGDNQVSSPSKYSILIVKFDGDGNIQYYYQIGSSLTEDRGDYSFLTINNIDLTSDAVYVTGLVDGSLTVGDTQVNSSGQNSVFTIQFPKQF